MNILVTSLSRKVPLLASLRAAANNGPVPGAVWGADSDPECVGRYFADRFWQMPPLSEPDADRQVLDLCLREEIGLAVPTRDGELPFFAGLRESLMGRGTYVPIGSPDAIEVCLDKLLFHRHCIQEGIPTAPTSTSIEASAGKRWVVKERRGMGARQVGVGLDGAAAQAHGARLEEPIYQPRLEGHEHSVDLYVNRSGQVVDAAPRARLRVHDGESTVTETVEHPELVAATVTLAESLDLRGHVVVQAFVRGSDVTVLECNPRVGGASTLGFHAGVDTPRWAIQEASGQTVEPRLGSYRRGLRLVRYPADRLIDP